jgi:ADP-heptose:LPS heptosyltransferase
MLVSTPVIHRLRVLYPKAELNILTSPLGAIALEGNPDIDHIFIYNKKSIQSILTIIHEIRKLYDIVVGFNKHSKTIRFLTMLTRGKKKDFLNHGKLAEWNGRPEDSYHYTGIMLRELEYTFNLPHDENPDIHIQFHVSDSINKDIQTRYPRIDGYSRIGIFIGNIKKIGLRWPIEKFVELTEKILYLNSNIEIYIVAGECDIPLLDAYKDKNNPHMHFFIGNKSLQDTAAFIKTCDAFVTCTSSPQHLAGAMDVPTVSITYPWSEKLWTPRGKRNFSAVSDINDDVRGISVQEVYETLNKTMQGNLMAWQDDDIQQSAI